MALYESNATDVVAAPQVGPEYEEKKGIDVSSDRESTHYDDIQGGLVYPTGTLICLQFGDSHSQHDRRGISDFASCL